MCGTQTLLARKRKEVGTERRRYASGLDQLNSAAEAVDSMQAELTDLKPKLVVAKVSIGLYTILPSPILYGVWHTKGGSVGGGGGYGAQWPCNSFAIE